MTKEEWYKQLFEHLEASKFRSSFHLKQKDIDYLNEKGMDVIYIGADLPSEYSGSKYTHSIKGNKCKSESKCCIRFTTDNRDCIWIAF